IPVNRRSTTTRRPSMGEEGDFIRGILADPKDDALLLVYSDWLEDQGDPASVVKAEFLRTTVRPPKKGNAEEKERRERLQTRAAALDTDWLGIVSRLPVENCHKKPEKGQPRAPQSKLFQFLCSRKWEELRPADEKSVRYCESCDQNVHYCDTIAT